MVEMFEEAMRKRFRFDFNGSINTEDLWTLPVEDLDIIYKKLSSEIKETDGESLLTSNSKEEVLLNKKIDIVKYIVFVKLEEQKDRLDAKERKEMKQKLLRIKSEKEEAGLYQKSPEELDELINSL